MHQNKGSKNRKTHPVAPTVPGATVQSGRSSSSLLLAARILLTVALGISLYLAYTSFTAGSLAGCGVNSDCHSVLSSKWAYIAGVPVSVPAAVLYLLVILATFQLRPQKAGGAGLMVTFGAVAILVAAVGFATIQLVVLKQICPYCMGAHLAGAIASILLLREGRRLGWFAQKQALGGVFAGAGAAALLFLLQAATSERPSFGQAQYASAGPTNVQTTANSSGPAAALKGDSTVEHSKADQTSIASPSTNGNGQAGALAEVSPATPSPNYLLPIIQGAFTLDLRHVPVEGPLNAPHKLVKIFDFTCHHCRELHHLLDQARSTFSNQLALVMLPLPLEAKCNPVVTRTSPSHVNACEYASIGLAVSRAAPHKFAQFSKWIFQPPTPPPVEQTRAFAAELVGADNLERELATGASAEQIRQDVEIYRLNSQKGKTGKVPQLIFPNGASFGSIGKLEDLYGLLNQHYGLSTAP